MPDGRVALPEACTSERRLGPPGRQQQPGARAFGRRRCVRAGELAECLSSAHPQSVQTMPSPSGCGCRPIRRPRPPVWTPPSARSPRRRQPHQEAEPVTETDIRPMPWENGTTASALPDAPAIRTSKSSAIPSVNGCRIAEAAGSGSPGLKITGARAGLTTRDWKASSKRRCCSRRPLRRPSLSP